MHLCQNCLEIERKGDKFGITCIVNGKKHNFFQEIQIFSENLIKIKFEIASKTVKDTAKRAKIKKKLNFLKNIKFVLKFCGFLLNR